MREIEQKECGESKIERERERDTHKKEKERVLYERKTKRQSVKKMEGGRERETR